MSSDSLAAFRRSLGPELSDLAEEHFKHDLNETDRNALKAGANTVSLHTTVGSVVGISLGLFLAFRLRSNRQTLYRTLRTADRPTHLKFADGREESIPDLTPFMKPSTLGDVTTYSLLGLGGLFFGGEVGLLSGSVWARSSISKDPDSRERIEVAFRRFRADVLRKQAEELEKQGQSGGLYGL